MRLASPMPEPRGERYDWYFDQLTAELTKQRYPYAGNCYQRGPGANSRIYSCENVVKKEGGVPTIGYRVWFPGPRYRDISVALGLAIDFKYEQVSKLLFEILKERRATIEEKIGYELDWDRYLDSDQPKRHKISIWHSGTNTICDFSKENLEEIGDWHVEGLFAFEQVFTEEIDKAISWRR